MLSLFLSLIHSEDVFVLAIFGCFKDFGQKSFYGWYFQRMFKVLFADVLVLLQMMNEHPVESVLPPCLPYLSL